MHTPQSSSIDKTEEISAETGLLQFYLAPRYTCCGPFIDSMNFSCFHLISVGLIWMFMFMSILLWETFMQYSYQRGRNYVRSEIFQKFH